MNDTFMRIKMLLLLCIGLMCSWNPAKAQDQDTVSHTKLRTLVNLLDYIGKDYPNAIKDGTVVSSSEYKEMTEFSNQIESLHQQISNQLANEPFTSLAPSIDSLHQAVAAKAAPDDVARIASGIQQQILALNLITITPSSWPDLEHGEQIFGRACQSCHGTQGFGDGPLAAGLEPKPANFHDSSLAAKLSPLQAYNTIRLGIEGTGMRAFHELSDQEVWNVAFYINSLNYDQSLSNTQSDQIKKAIQDTVSIRTLSTWKNEQWAAYLKSHGIDKTSGLAVVRSMNRADNKDQIDYLAYAIELLNKAGTAYATNQKEQAQTYALNAYLHGIEPMENQIKASKASLVSELENRMIDTRSAIKKNASPDVVQTRITAATLSIREAQELLKNQEYSFWFTFMMAASILLREGLEAVLIILVIISVLKSMGADLSLKYVHGGWITALALGIASWFFTETLIQMSPFQREIMEGVGSLIAVGMLIYIGFWLHNKTYASQWTKFVKKKITRLVDENNRWGLALLAFIVVFREAFESVIFLSSVSIKSTAAGNSGILIGAASAMGLVLLLAVIIIKFSKRVPIRSLFKYSSFIMSVLAVVLVGKGIHEFQEAGYIGVHSLPTLPDLPLLGLYPSLFTIMAQVAIAGFIVLLWQYSKRLGVAQN